MLIGEPYPHFICPFFHYHSPVSIALYHVCTFFPLFLLAHFGGLGTFVSMNKAKTERVVVTVEVRGADRVKALDALKRLDHSSRSSVLNKGLDLLVSKEMEGAAA